MRRKLRLISCIAVVAFGTYCARRHAAGAESAVSASRIFDGNRLTYLDENNPWYPHRNFPKLITPQWVGEEGVECVVVLAIDDMREPGKYEAFLRPILNRLKQIDGRAPVSIMTCNVKPDDPQLAQWLAEGLSLEVHTIDHPCPLLQGGDFAKAKSTYDRCVDLLNEISGNKPVAFRMPCCDSLNTLSPRFYAEIFNNVTPKLNYLSISSSIFNLFTPNDPEIPRGWCSIPTAATSFANTCQRSRARGRRSIRSPISSKTTRIPTSSTGCAGSFPVSSRATGRPSTCKSHSTRIRSVISRRRLDITVLKQGVYNLVFHPHNWIKPEQVVEIINHAVAKHGRKVKFLTFREALERLNKNLLGDVPLRGSWGVPGGVRVVDINHDGFVDVLSGGSALVGNIKSHKSKTWIWAPASGNWRECPFPTVLANYGEHGGVRDLGGSIWDVRCKTKRRVSCRPRMLLIRRP